MRLISRLFNQYCFPAPRALVTFVLVTAVTAVLTPAQPTDDPYGLSGSADSTSASEPPSSSLSVSDSANNPGDTVSAPDTAVGIAPSPAPVPPVVPTPSPRVRVTRETTINPLNTKRGAFRNPKKALFMSLLVPGLGQAYVGQSPYTYARAAFYFGTEITLGVMWYHYTVVKYDRVTKRYRRFADEHWSMQDYEQRAFDESAVEDYEFINPRRTTYCEAVQDRESPTGNNLYNGCLNLLDADSAALSSNYQSFKNAYTDKATPEAQGEFRATFNDPVEFYSLIGGYQEFIAGWDDIGNTVVYSADSITGSSANRDAYNRMRQQAQDYSRMQAWFIGGIVINHIASAVDAALTARHHNRVLYEGEARWYDRIRMDGGLAFDAGRPRTHMAARLSF